MTAPILNDLADWPDHGNSDHLEFLAAFSQAFAVSADLEPALAKTLAGLTQVLHAEAGALFLHDEEAGELICRASVGPLDSGGTRLRAGQGLIGRCLCRNEVTVIHDAGGASDLLGAAQASKEFRIRSALCAPMTVGDRRFGAIQVVNKVAGEAFGESDSHLLQAVANLAALALARARLADKLARQEGVDRELDLAAEIQRNLLPNSAPGACPVHGLNRPIRQVSGDFFDFFTLSDGPIPFALGDVSGKGINAALLMAKAASLFRCLGKCSDDPATLLGILNREIHETTSRGMFVTMVAGTYDPATGLVRFANAGHEPPLLRQPDRSYQAFPAETPPLGIVPDMEFRTREINLDGGEFYIFSDGLVEFRYGEGEELGVEGLIQLVEGLSELPLPERLRALLAELDRAGWEMRDDLTVLAIDDDWVRRHD
ncbi:MAG: SpoIIE family protein phosphatase [Kiloniellaceae bacterium]